MNKFFMSCTSKTSSAIFCQMIFAVIFLINSCSQNANTTVTEEDAQVSGQFVVFEDSTSSSTAQPKNFYFGMPTDEFPGEAFDKIRENDSLEYVEAVLGGMGEFIPSHEDLNERMRIIRDCESKSALEVIDYMSNNNLGLNYSVYYYTETESGYKKYWLVFDEKHKVIHKTIYEPKGFSEYENATIFF